MLLALHSPKLQNWTWDPNYKTDWFGNIPPSPETFRLFDELMQETGEYRLEKYFMPGTDFEVDFIGGVFIYRRITTEKPGVTQRPQNDERKFHAVAYRRLLMQNAETRI